jgi:hypothetical protein
MGMRPAARKGGAVKIDLQYGKTAATLQVAALPQNMPRRLTVPQQASIAPLENNIA